MESWNQREEMNILIYLIRGGGHNILINTGPPQDLRIINQAWLNFFGYPEAQIVRSEAQLPQNILHSQGLTPDDISTVLVTPLQAYATANIPLFRKATIGISRRGWIEDFQAPFYHLHVPDTADDSGADGMRVDRDGRLYVTTRMGVQVCDQAGRVNCIIPTPNGRIANLCFGGANFDTLFATCGDTVYSRKLKTKGLSPSDPPLKPKRPQL